MVRDRLGVFSERVFVVLCAYAGMGIMCECGYPCVLWVCMLSACACECMFFLGFF